MDDNASSLERKISLAQMRLASLVSFLLILFVKLQYGLVARADVRLLSEQQASDSTHVKLFPCVPFPFTTIF